MSMQVLTKGEWLALCKLVQIVVHADEYEKVDMKVWEEKLKECSGLDPAASRFFIDRLRKMSNHTLGELNELVV